MAKRSKTDQAAFDLAADQLGGGAPSERPMTLRHRSKKKAAEPSRAPVHAKKAATRRYHELMVELAEIFEAFPHLRYGSAVSPSMPDAVEEPKVRRRPYKTPIKPRKRGVTAKKRS
jgi:hypothetical protein